ncbi:MAG: DUF3341 domain-containing protein [Bdellovibrionales bacterium]|nr:DUF3341 domain-containing protein [Bdellovibrionales bacterium]
MDIIDKVISKLRPKARQGMAGIWLDEHKFVEAAGKVRQSGYTKFDAISPFPLHGIDDAMGIPFSYIPWVTLTFGLTGFSFGTWFTWWASSQDWAINIGGKPMWSLPAFIPIMFECTILLAALSSVGALLWICNLPMIDPPVIDPDLTSHKFGLFVPEDDTGYDAAKLEQLFRQLGAVEVKKAEF